MIDRKHCCFLDESIKCKIFIIYLLFQSLLRGRFLRTERTAEDERPPSVAANELHQLRQRNTVSGLRCAHLFIVYILFAICLSVKS